MPSSPQLGPPARRPRRAALEQRRSSSTAVPAKPTPRAAEVPTAATMSSVRKAMCCTPAPACQVEEVVDLARAAAQVRLDQHERHPPDGLCTTLESIALPADLDVLLEDLREAEDLLVVARPSASSCAGRHADRQVVDLGEQRGRRPALGRRLGSIAPGRNSRRAPRRSTSRWVTSPKPRHLGDHHRRRPSPVAGASAACTAVAPAADQLGVRAGGVVDLEARPRPRRHRGGATYAAAGWSAVSPEVSSDPDVALAEQQRALAGQPGLRAALAVDVEAERGARGRSAACRASPT